MVLSIILSILTLCSANAFSHEFHAILSDKIITLDPLKSSDRYSQHIINQIYSNLFELKPGLVLEPNVVEKYSYNRKELTYTFHLKKNVFFHNNVELTADDVLFTFKRICRLKKKIRVSPLIKGCLSNSFEGLKKQGRYSFSIQVTKHFPPFLSYLACSQFEVLPNNLFGQPEESFFANPIGSGAYKLHRNQDDLIILKSHENYFLGTSDIESIFYHVKNNKNLTQLLQQEKLDSFFPLSPPKKYPPLYQEVLVHTASTILLYPNTKKPPYDEKNFRLLLRKIIDKKNLFNTLEKKHENIALAHGVIPFGAIGYLPHALPEKNNSSISSLLKKYASKVKKGIKVHSVIKGQLGRDLREFITAQFKKYNLKINYIQTDLPSLFKAIKNKTIEMMCINLTMTSIDSYQYLEFFRSDFSESGLKISHPQFDYLLDQSLHHDDRFKRAGVYKEANSFLYKNIYSLNLLHLKFLKTLQSKKWIFPNANILGNWFQKMFDIKRNKKVFSE